jgi:hypothetical protein
MGDPAIEEVYGLARDMKSRIQVLILPSREIKAKTILDSQLKAINDSFGSKHFLPKVRTSPAGSYEITP